MLGFGGKKFPDTQDVVQRAYALRAVIPWCFATPPPDVVEQLQLERSPAEWAQFTREIDAMNAGRLREIKQQPYAKALTPIEQSILGRSVTEATWEDFLTAQWRLESVQVLLWALGRIPMAPIGSAEQASDELLKPPTMPPFETAVSTWQLRDRAEIEKARDLAEVWHWRSRTRQLIEEGETLDPETMEATGFQSYDDIVRHTAQAAQNSGDLDVIDGDFSVHGRPYRDLDEEAWLCVQSITMERHFALNWLCGYAPKHRWDDTPTDT